MPSGMSHADLLRALMQWCPMITNDEDKGALLAGAAALEAQAQREGERAPLACINCGEANDGGYETPSVGPFCSLCWDELRAALSPAGTAKEEDRG
jgi:hypothetical protein